VLIRKGDEKKRPINFFFYYNILVLMCKLNNVSTIFKSDFASIQTFTYIAVIDAFEIIAYSFIGRSVIINNQ